MSRNAVETVMGAVVLVVAALFLFFAYTTSQVSAISGGYDITARFDHVEGLRDGTDVRISGIKVGQIVSQTLDPKTFQAVVRMDIYSQYKLPVDTVATIDSNGLLGEDYLSLVPGNEDQTIPPGGTIQHTQSPMNLQSLIGQYIFSQQPAGKPAGAVPSAPAAGGAGPGAGLTDLPPASLPQAVPGSGNSAPAK